MSKTSLLLDILPLCKRLRVLGYTPSNLLLFSTRYFGQIVFLFRRLFQLRRESSSDRDVENTFVDPPHRIHIATILLDRPIERVSLVDNDRPGRFSSQSISPCVFRWAHLRAERRGWNDSSHSLSGCLREFYTVVSAQRVDCPCDSPIAIEEFQTRTQILCSDLLPWSLCSTVLGRGQEQP